MNRPANTRTSAASKATPGWPPPWAIWPPASPAPALASSAPDTDVSPAAADHRKRSSRPATRSWSSSTTCRPTPPPSSTIWAATTSPVEGLLDVGQFAVLGFLECHGDGVGLAFVAQVAEDPELLGGPGAEKGQHLGVFP